MGQLYNTSSIFSHEREWLFKIIQDYYELPTFLAVSGNVSNIGAD